MIPFIDLNAQQELIRDKIDKRIKQVLDHGQYILGPEVRAKTQYCTDRIFFPSFVSTDSFPGFFFPEFFSPDLLPELFSPILDHRGVQG